MRGDKRERILRVILNSNKPLSKNEISVRAGCSRQWVILFLRELEKKGLINGTAIADRKALLEYWITIAGKPKRFRSYMVKDPLSILRKTEMEYAATTYLAENLVQHFLFPARIDLYVREKDIDGWHRLLLHDGLYGKGNVRVILSDEHIMYAKEKVDGIYAVSIPQLIVDLAKEGGPAAEAAEMLKEVQNVQGH